MQKIFDLVDEDAALYIKLLVKRIIKQLLYAMYIIVILMIEFKYQNSFLLTLKSAFFGRCQEF